nr:enoyl-CoA hydratase-related protein [uncultured Gellertiella sp.]
MKNATGFTADFAGSLMRVACTDHKGVLVLDNPRRKNAVTAAMWRAIPAAIDALVEEAGARVIVITGAGAVDFSAGADISEFAEVRGDAVSAARYEAENAAAFAAIRAAPVPTIAVIRGICYGGGFGLAAACDLRLGDPTARFCIPPARLGLAYPVDAIRDIVTGLGNQMARLALYTGQVMHPEQLKEQGFLLDCIATDRLEQAASSLAETIAANAPLSIRASKLAIRGVSEADPALGRDAGIIGASTFDSADYAEGRQAFAERRKPHFTGR